MGRGGDDGAARNRKIAIDNWILHRNNAIVAKEARMPRTEVVLFAEEGGAAPLLQWLDGLPSKVRDKCIVRIERLAELGHEIRRPEADFLRDGIYELRASHHSVHYRMLYFFHERRAVLTHGLTKECEVPDREIDLAVRRRLAFESAPREHTYLEEE